METDICAQKLKFTESNCMKINIWDNICYSVLWRELL